MTRAASTLHIGGLTIEVLPKAVQRMYLHVYPPDGQVVLTVPEGTVEAVYRLFVIDQWSWVKRQIRAFEAQPRQTERQYCSGENHYFQGKRYLLRVVDAPHRPAVRLTQQYLYLQVPPHSTRAQREQRLQNWYRQQLKALIPPLIEQWAPRLGVDAPDWGVKRMKTKWGSCNPTARRIWLNLELVKKPIHCLEYIVVHELVHLLEPTHNERFMAYMDRFLPRWPWLRQELNRQPAAHWDWTY